MVLPRIELGFYPFCEQVLRKIQENLELVKDMS